MSAPVSDSAASISSISPCAVTLSKSTQDMVVQIVIDDTEIVQSDLLKPGNQVTELDLLDNAEKQLEKGGYDGKFRVLFYDPDSGQKATVNTEIPISITVE